MNNILCCNAGRRGRLMIDMRKTIGDSGNVVATDNWSVAPAIFFANKQYVVPKITHPNYIQEVLGICKNEGGNLAASKIRNLECPSYEICLIDYGCGKFNRKIHIMEQYP